MSDDFWNPLSYWASESTCRILVLHELLPTPLTFASEALFETGS